MRLKDRVCIVTGGAGGIGRATVAQLVRDGARVVVADRDLDAAQRVVDEVGASHAMAHQVDVASHSQIEELVARAVMTYGRLDVMFNNAGIAGGRPLLEHDPERDYFPMIRVDQDSVYFGILAAARQFVAQRSPGVIISTSSIYGESAAPNAFAYGAATGGPTASSAALGIRAVAITPGRVNTPMIQRLGPELGRMFAEQQASGRLTEPEEIARTVAFLASDDASAINGTVVHVDDGYSAFKQRFEPPRFD